MPTSKNNRSAHIETHRRGRMTEKSSSFHGGAATGAMSASQIRRPKTEPNLASDRKRATAMTAAAEFGRREPPKLLVKVTMMGSLGPVQLLMRPESTVAELVAAAVQQYVKEGRRPILRSTDPSHFELHYSQFSLESLEREEKLRGLGSRNFFLCPKKCDDTSIVDNSKTTPFGSCSKEADKASKGGGAFGWLRFIDFLF